MGEDSPSFQLYPRDLLADTDNLTDAAFGLYVRLLCKQWLHGSLPAAFESEDGESMMDVLPIGDIKERRRSWKAIARHFKPHPEQANRVVQSRLERVRAAQAERRIEASEAGRRGAEKRWGRRGEPTPPPLPSDSHPIETLMANDNSASASASASAHLASLGERAVPSPAMRFGSWVFGVGLEAGVIPPHHVTDPGPMGFAYKHLEASETLIATYGVDECQRRALNMVARKARTDGDKLLLAATPTTLRDRWEWFDAAERERPAKVDSPAPPLTDFGAGYLEMATAKLARMAESS